MDAMRDPYYEDKVKPDEEHLLDLLATRVLVGREIGVIRSGIVLSANHV